MLSNDKESSCWKIIDFLKKKYDDVPNKMTFLHKKYSQVVIKSAR
jgi:hypothetical protein